MRWLMTQSLLSSWLYQFSAQENYADVAHDDFLALLHRQPREMSEAAQKGIDFEKLVYSICDGNVKDDPWYEQARHIADHVKGGARQFVACKDIVIDGIHFFLYGKLDCLKAGTIYDIKFTSHYSVGKFFNSPQHPMYFEIVPEAKRFVYLVSNGRATWEEEYLADTVHSVIPLIRQFVQYLEVNNLLPIYFDKWKARN